MKGPDTALLIFAKAPIPGQAKTRLIPALGKVGAAELQQRLLANTVQMTKELGECAVELWCTPDTEHPAFSTTGLPLQPQQGADLGERLSRAMQAALEHYPVAIVIGTDCPELKAEDIRHGLRLLQAGNEAVIGPAADGGYYLLGLSRFEPSLFEGVSWGDNTVLEETLERLQRAGMHCEKLTVKHDLDRPEDLYRFPEL
ncbi:MAG: TIGR04282 family arsenosugar biosynthesis glycosyltransferase [Pseudomonadota bacterium]